MVQIMRLNNYVSLQYFLTLRIFKIIAKLITLVLSRVKRFAGNTVVRPQLFADHATRPSLHVRLFFNPCGALGIRIHRAGPFDSRLRGKLVNCKA